MKPVTPSDSVAPPSAILPRPKVAEHTSDGPNERVAPVTLRPARAITIFLLLQLPLFFDGCDSNLTYFSSGVVANFARFEFTGDDFWPGAILDFSARKLYINVATLVALLWFVRTRMPRLATYLAKRSFLISLVVSVLLLNSFLISGGIWRTVAWTPTMYLHSGICCVCFGDESQQHHDLLWPIIVASRMYFAILIVAGDAAIRLVRYLAQRYLLVDPARWWQYNLSGMMVVAVVMGTAIGMVVRLLI